MFGSPVRWLIRRNEVTAEEVREYAAANDLPLMTAKRILINESLPVLQYRNVAGRWLDVPTCVISDKEKEEVYD